MDVVQEAYWTGVAWPLDSYLARVGARSPAAWWPRRAEGRTPEAAGVRVGARSLPGPSLQRTADTWRTV